MVAAGATRDVVVELQAHPTVEETVTVVASTRTDKRLEDQPMRVEVLAREEIEEKMLMTPGDIVMMLNEMGGMRVQATSPSLGAASVRIQGMRGRYTRVLSDGLPLFGEVGGLVRSRAGHIGAEQSPVSASRPRARAGLPAESIDPRCDVCRHLSFRPVVSQLECLAAGWRTLAGNQRRQ